MSRNRVKITITVQRTGEDGELTKLDQWDIITAAAITTRAAIEQYVLPRFQDAAADAIGKVLRAPRPDHAKVSLRLVEAPGRN